MALKTFVKISRVNNLSDARYCAGMGVALLGFNCEPGTLHYVAPEKFRELSEWVAGVSFVAEFSSATPQTIGRLLGEYSVDYLQTDVPAYLGELKQLGLPLILKIEVETQEQAVLLPQLMQEQQPHTEFFLLQLTSNISKDKALMSNILNLSNDFEMVVSMPLDAAELDQLLSQYPLKGISLEGGEEIRAGYKDFDELAEILEILEVDEA